LSSGWLEEQGVKRFGLEQITKSLLLIAMDEDGFYDDIPFALIGIYNLQMFIL
jgi:hypothetical protein